MCAIRIVGAIPSDLPTPALIDQSRCARARRPMVMMRGAPVAGFAAGVDDVVAGSDDPVRQPVVAHEPRDVLHRVRLLRARGRRRDVVRRDRRADLRQPARSAIGAAWAPRATARPISARRVCMASASAKGMSGPAASPLAGRTAPKMQARFVRQSGAARGRVPRRAHRRAIGVDRPGRASSCRHRSVPAGRPARISAGREASRTPSGRQGLAMMARPRRRPPVAHGARVSPQRPATAGDAERLPDPAARDPPRAGAPRPSGYGFGRPARPATAPRAASPRAAAPRSRRSSPPRFGAPPSRIEADANGAPAHPGSSTPAPADHPPRNPPERQSPPRWRSSLGSSCRSGIAPGWEFLP